VPFLQPTIDAEQSSVEQGMLERSINIRIRRLSHVAAALQALRP